MKGALNLRGLGFVALVLAALIAGGPSAAIQPSAAAGIAPTIVGCPTLPADNIWNARVDSLPVHSRSADYINSIGATTGLKGDFGSGLWNGATIGIPYTTVPGTQSRVPISFTYVDESDPSPYPIPPDALIQGGSDARGDRHVLVVDRDNCVLYELFKAYPQADGSWQAVSGAVFPLTSDQLRPLGWTSADAAGLPILPGLARYEEVAAGEIAHALRFTAATTQNAYIWPARHFASKNKSLSTPPMGLRVRLKADKDISSYSPQVQVILRGLKTYGMILADEGANWYINGVPDSRWDNDALRELANIQGSDLEVVDDASLMVSVDSGQAASAGPSATATPTPSAVATATPTATLAPLATATPTPTPHKGKRR